MIQSRSRIASEFSDGCAVPRSVGRHVVRPVLDAVEVFECLGQLIEGDVRGRHQAEGREYADRLQRGLSVAVEHLAGDRRDLLVVEHRLGLGSGDDERVRGDVVAVGVAEDQVGEPPQPFGLGRVGGDQAEDGVGDGVGIVGLDRVLDGRAYGAVLEQRPWCRRERAQSLERRVDGLRVHHADAVLPEGGQDVGRDLRAWEQQTAGAADEPSVGERDGQSAERLTQQGIRHHAGQRAVEVPPPLGRLVGRHSPS